MLGEFEQLVLLALMRLGEEAYGVSVHEEIERRSGRSVSAGTVYRALLRLESKGLAESWEGEPTPERGGRRKRHYRVLPEGRAAVSESLAVLGRMAEGVGGLPDFPRPSGQCAAPDRVPKRRRPRPQQPRQASRHTQNDAALQRRLQSHRQDR